MRPGLIGSSLTSFRAIMLMAMALFVAGGIKLYGQGTKTTMPVTDWNKELAELCTYDPNYCKNLKNEDGTWVRPKKEILAALKQLNPKIQSYSEKFGVDPRAVAGAVLAENSLNVSISDGVQDFLVKYGLAKNGEVLGKKFSFGWGQLYMEAAREAENFAAKLEKRTPKTDEQLSEDLLKPDLAVYYVAALMRTIQDEYAKQGIDISKNPELLVTVYNLGKPKERAAKTKASGNAPRVNYFGFFVKHYMSDIESAVGKPKLQTVVADQKDATKKDAASKSLTSKTTVGTSTLTETEPKVWRTVMIKSLALYVAPPTCKLQNGQNSVKTKYESFQNFASSGIAEKATGYKVLAPAIDCESEAWSLVRTDDGTTGWAKNADLEKSSSKQLVVAPKCTNTVSKNCGKAVSEAAKTDFIETDSKAGLVYLKPVTTPGGNANFKDPDWNCSGGSRGYGGRIVGGLGGGYPGMNPSATNLSGSNTIPAKQLGQPFKPVHSLEELKSMKSRWDAKAEEIWTLFGLEKNEGMYSPKNPYSIVRSFGRMPFVLQQCISAQAGQLDFCKFDVKGFDQLLSSFVIKKNPSLTELSTLDTDIGNFIDNSKQVGQVGYWSMMSGSVSMYSATADDLKTWTLDDVKKELQRCVDFYRTQSIWPKTVDVPSDLAEIADLCGKLDDKTFAALASYFISAAKGCGMIVDVISGTDVKGTSSGDVSGICNPTPEVMPYHWTLLSRDVVASLLRSDSAAGKNYMINVIGDEFPYNARQQVKILLNQSATLTSMQVPVQQVYPSYCPNRTAEFIEELLKNNPCVRTVYVPDRWLVNRLNEFGAKVMYRPFVEDDRYAVDVSKQVCK